MYGEATYTESSYGEGLGIGVPIIPEVAVEGKALVYVVELDLIKPGET